MVVQVKKLGENLEKKQEQKDGDEAQASQQIVKSLKKIRKVIEKRKKVGNKNQSQK